MIKINPDHPPAGKNPRKLRILVAPLDWGLGHATRCIPVVYELKKQDVDVWLAGEAAQEALLREEFPDLPFLALEGYRVRYAPPGRNMAMHLLRQVPRILKSVRREHQWLRQSVKEHGFDAIISDNRYGLWHPDIPSIFITHQLAIQTSFGKAVGALLRKRHYRFINRFTECWVPDVESDQNLAGELSHPAILPRIPTHYIGTLSRLSPLPMQSSGNNHLFISLSGPEPQRTQLENILIRDIVHYNGTACIVRGLPHQQSFIPSTNDLQFHNHLRPGDFAREMNKAAFVICRSGYSSLMDIMRMKKKAILVPTPGQTEQEYLGRYLVSKHLALSILQNKFSLETALRKAATFPYKAMSLAETHALQTRIEAFLATL